MPDHFRRLGIVGATALLSALLWTGAGGTPVAVAAEGDALSLTDALELAERQAPGVEEAARELAQARSAYRELRGGYLPQVTLNGNVDGDETGGSGTGQFGFHDPAASLGVGVTVPLTELAGIPSAATERAAYDVRSAERALDHAKEDAKLAAIEAYIGVVNAENQLDLRHRSVEKTNRLVEQTRLRYELGEATQLDVMEAEQQQSDGELGAAEAENAREAAYAALNRALGRAVDAPVEVAPFETGGSPLLDSEGGGLSLDLPSAVTVALARRVEVLLAEEQLELFDRTQALTPDPGKPFVSFSAGYEWDDASVAVRRTTIASDTAGGGQVAGWELSATGAVESGDATSERSSQDPELGWNVGVGVTWPLFTGGQAEESRRQTELQREARRAAIEQAEESVRLDVRSQRSALELALKALDIREQALAQARESLRVIRLQHEAGAVTDSDLLDAELNALQAEFDKEAARYEIWLAAARYDRALGLPIFGGADGGSRDEEGAR